MINLMDTLTQMLSEQEQEQVTSIPLTSLPQVFVTIYTDKCSLDTTILGAFESNPLDTINDAFEDDEYIEETAYDSLRHEWKVYTNYGWYTIRETFLI